jgi:hypothetical protein
MNKSKLYFIALALLICCNSQNENVVEAGLKRFYSKGKYPRALNTYKKVVIISENGTTCLNCDRKFAKEMEAYIDSDSVLFVLSGLGNKIDYSFFTEQNRTNVILDQGSELRNLDSLDGSCIIDLDSLGNIQKVNRININRYINNINLGL